MPRYFDHANASLLTREGHLLTVFSSGRLFASRPMEEDDHITVMIRTKATTTVGELRAAVVDEVANSLYIGNKKLSNDAETLAEAGITPDATITNSPKSTSPSLLKGPLSVNSFVRVVFGMMTLFKFPRIPKENVNLSLTVFSNKARPALITILNLLDPISFVNFSQTCHYGYDLCRSKKSGISVPFKCFVVSNPQGVRLKIQRQGEGNRTIYGGILRNLKNFPFHLNIQVIFKEYGLTAETIESVSEFVKQFKSYSILAVLPKQWMNNKFANVHCWREFSLFLNEFNVREVNFDCYPMLDGVISVMLTNVEELWVDGGAIPLQLLGLARLKLIVMNEAEASGDYIKGLIEMVASGRTIQMGSWEISSQVQGRRAFSSCFRGIEKISKTLTGPLPSTRPLCCCINRNYYSILSTENKLFCVANWHGMIMIGKAADRESVSEAFIPFL